MKYTHLVQYGVRSVYIVILILLCSEVIGQNWDRVDIDFRKDGKLLVNSGINGLVAPQFSNTDFNGDGKTDLFVFDRQSGVVMTFLWDDDGDEGMLKYAPDYARSFPELINFAKLIDYDRDGDEDLFTFASTSPGSNIAHYRNEGSRENPVYVLVEYPQANADVLNYQLSNGTFAEIYNANTDIPAIADIDYDGDVDILAFEQVSGSKVLFFQNMQVENNLPNDSMFFKLTDYCWGQFVESGTASDIYLSDNAQDCASGIIGDIKVSSSFRHAGSTIEVFDNNGDGLVDCLIGDLSNNTLAFLENGGNQDNAWMIELNNNFPTIEEQIDMPVFLTPSYVDVNNDGARDLVVSQNTTNSGINSNHIWLYENIGTDADPTFKLKTTNFLHESSLKIPEGSKPSFVDIDQDGRLDLIVGSYGYNNGSVFGDVRLFYFKNTGTLEQPTFTFQTDDYLNISQYTTISRSNPAFGDLNGDGAIDMILGEESGSLIYFENQSVEGSPMLFGQPIFDYFGIDDGKESKPQLVDLTGDGLLDLVVGESGDDIDPHTGIIGSPSFYENVGTQTDPFFSSTPTTKSLGGIFTRTETVLRSDADPVFIPTDNKSDFLTIVGSNYGELFLYEDVLDNLLDSFTLVTDSLPLPRYGWKTGVDAADIDNDNYYEIVIGNENGGLVFHNTPFQVTGENAVDHEPILKDMVYPIPVQDKLTIVSESEVRNYSIRDVTGQIVKRNVVENNKINIEDLVSGFYILILDYGGVNSSHKIVKR